MRLGYRDLGSLSRTSAMESYILSTANRQLETTYRRPYILQIFSTKVFSFCSGITMSPSWGWQGGWPIILSKGRLSCVIVVVRVSSLCLRTLTRDDNTKPANSNSSSSRVLDWARLRPLGFSSSAIIYSVSRLYLIHMVYKFSYGTGNNAV